MESDMAVLLMSCTSELYKIANTLVSKIDFYHRLTLRHYYAAIGRSLTMFLRTNEQSRVAKGVGEEPFLFRMAYKLSPT